MAGGSGGVGEAGDSGARVVMLGFGKAMGRKEALR